jgi:hypothetical protein
MVYINYQGIERARTMAIYFFERIRDEADRSNEWTYGGDTFTIGGYIDRCIMISAVLKGLSVMGT